MLAKSVFTKSKHQLNDGFKNFVATNLKNITASTNTATKATQTLTEKIRTDLLNYINNKKRGKQDNKDGTDARLIDWLKYLCALLVLYVTTPTNDGNDEIPKIAANDSAPSTQQNQEHLSDDPEPLPVNVDGNSNENANKMYGMIGDDDVPLPPGSYETETPPKPPCYDMPIKQDPPKSTVTPSPQNTHFTQQSTQNPMNQYIPKLQPTPQTVTPNPKQQNGWTPMPPQAQDQLPTHPNNSNAQATPAQNLQHPNQTQVQPKIRTLPTHSNFQPQPKTYQQKPQTHIPKPQTLSPSNRFHKDSFFIPDLRKCANEGPKYYVTTPERVFVFPAADIDTLKTLVTQLPQTVGIPFDKVPKQIIKEFDVRHSNTQVCGLSTFAKLLFTEKVERMSVQFAKSFTLCFTYSGKNDKYNSFLDDFTTILNQTAYALAVFDQIEILKKSIATNSNETSNFETELKTNINQIISYPTTHIRILCSDASIEDIGNKTQDDTINWFEDQVLTDLQDDLPIYLEDLKNFLATNIPNWQDIKPSESSINTILDEIQTNILNCYKTHGHNTFDRY